MDNRFSMKGSNAVVTGATRGIGLAIARGFLESGATVTLCGRKQEGVDDALADLSDHASNVLGVAAHVGKVEDIERLIAEAEERFGPIDTLVNNAAGNFLCPSEELSPNAFAAVVGIVLHGTFHCTRAVGRDWIGDGQGGNVLNIVATYAWTGSAFVLPSACAKAGVLALTRSLSVEWARHGIRLNAIAPGPVWTKGAVSQLFPSEEFVKRREARIPAGRFGSPDEVAELAAFLVSDASAMIRGEAVTIDGGEWLSGAGEFNDLVDQPPSFWKAMRDRAGRK